MKTITICLTTLLLLTFLLTADGQTSGIFGGDNVASGYSNPSNTKDKWIKLGEFTINGAYSSFICTIEVFPKNSNHGDSHQELNIGFRNNATGIESTYNIEIFNISGQQKSVNNLKVIHTSGSGISNNMFSIWIQMGTSWLTSVPYELRYSMSSSATVSINSGNKQYFDNINDSGTEYNLTSNHGLINSNYVIDGDLNVNNIEANGTIHTKEVKVDLNGWSDFVFKDDYSLPSLAEVENHIKENGHLKDIPSEAEVEANGIFLGDMTSKLLQKIEELTLYTIAQEKKLKSQDGEIKTQNMILKSLFERLDKIEEQLKEKN